MNLKQNAWMYLFFASVLLWVGTVTFSCEAAPKAVDTPEMEKTAESQTAEVLEKQAPPCKTDPDSFRLTPAVALPRIAAYDKYSDKFPSVDTTKLTSKDAGMIINEDVQYFQLPHCELSDMLAKVGKGADIKAHLAIKDVVVNKVSVKEIVLIFEDTDTTVVATNKYYYDFVEPCPVDCGTSQTN